MYYLMARYKVIVTDDYNRYLRVFPLRPEQRVIQIWHACGAFKKFGKDGSNIAGKLETSTHMQYNLVSVSANNIRNIYAKAFQIDVDKVAALGCPRTDIFFDEKEVQRRKDEIYTKYPQLKDKFMILYAPTFRDKGKDKDRMTFKPKLDFKKLSANLKENQIFVVAPHPLMKNHIPPKGLKNVIQIQDISTNDLMLISSMLITDYSSVIFEYALLHKPILFYCYDLLEYNRGFYLKYPEDLPGDVLYTTDELIEYLADEQKCNTVSEKYDDFVNNYMSACDGHSSERIAKLINEYVEDK
jgi:CDP-glycerol glycerophosphotransferase (TagB/SpsB family)